MNEKWQTVPAEPTQEMLAVISNESEIYPDADALYAALIAAAPKQETLSIERVSKLCSDAAREQTPKQQEQAPADRDGLIRRLRAVCETGCDPDLPFEAADEIALRRRLLREQMQLTNQRTEEILRLTAERDGLLALLKEARLTFEMWKDVAPAFSLCADIDSAIAKVEKGGAA